MFFSMNDSERKKSAIIKEFCCEFYHPIVLVIDNIISNVFGLNNEISEK